jgi:methylated-DNA-[protein]-cysteine S-methyltransferase
MPYHPDTCLKTLQSPWGLLTLAANAKGLCGVWFENQKHFPDTQSWTVDKHNPLLLQAEQILEQFFQQKWPKGSSAHTVLKKLPLDLSGGTAFQQAVWQALMSIPMGCTCSYGELAAAIGRPRAVRAVGAAIGRNPISILIPCHRVLGTQGQLTGYAGGEWRKQSLLTLENANFTGKASSKR